MSDFGNSSFVNWWCLWIRNNRYQIILSEFFLTVKNQSDFWVREVKAENKWGKSSELKVRLAIDSGAIILVDMCSWIVAGKLGLSVVSVNWSDGWL